MHETRPSVSILIINYNTPELVGTLVDSLSRFVTRVSFEVWILNNGCSKKGGYSTKDAESRHLLIEDSPRNLGFAAGSNLLATKARGDYLLFANSDCEITSDIVTPMFQYMEQHPRCAACSPRTVYPDGTSYSTIRNLPTHKNIGSSRGAAIKTGKEKYTLETCDTRVDVEAMAATFMMVSAKAFRHAGGFDEQFFMYVEDTDLCKRLSEYGYSLAYLGDLEVRHKWGASTSRHPWRMKWYHHRSVWRYFRKHYPQKPVANLWLGIKLLTNFSLVSIQLLFSRERDR